MEFKTQNNVWLWFSQYFTGNWDYLPNSICPLFWTGLLGIITMIISPFYTIAAYLFTKLTKDTYKEIDTNPAINKILINIIIISLYLFGIIIVEFFTISLLEFEWYHFIISLLPAPIIIATITGMIIGWVYLEEKWEDHDTIVKTPSIIGEYYKAIKNNICPLIKWNKND